MGRRPTVYDVAARAGVSIATVSFAFTQPQRVKKSTLDAVLAAAGALGYVPSANARGLAKGRTGAIGLYSFDYLLDSVPVDQTDIRHFPLYVDEVQRGVQLECRQRGYALMLGAGHNPGHLPDVIDIAGRVDGLIAFAGSAPPEAIVQVAKRIPVVELGGDPERVHTVPVDNRGGMRQLTEHLLGVHGFRRLGYLGTVRLPEFDARYEGFAEALSAAGLPVPVRERSRPGDDASTAGTVERDIRAGTLPEAFVCATDQEALVAIDTLAAAGVEVPGSHRLGAAGASGRRVAVTGFDGTVAARFATPRLTTVRQPIEQVGRMAVRILAGLLNESEPERETLHTTLVVGESCGCKPG
jgi:DNA-binding LacI/PurR family transcriptional regulator